MTATEVCTGIKTRCSDSLSQMFILILTLQSVQPSETQNLKLQRLSETQWKSRRLFPEASSSAAREKIKNSCFSLCTLSIQFYSLFSLHAQP